MTSIEEARQRILEADERGEKASFDDVMTMLEHDRTLGQCVGIVMETMIRHVENHPKLPESHEEVEHVYTTPDRARLAVLHALDAGENPGPAIGRWLNVDRAAQALFRIVFQQCNAPDTILHLSSQGFVAAA